jgi:transposase
MGLEDQQAIQLYFTDETGFKLTPNIPYGRIPEKEQWTIRSSKDHVCNLFGLLSRTGSLKVYSTTQSINSDFIIECIDEIAGQIQIPTVLVMDNAPWHKSKAVEDKRIQWDQKGLYLFYLPTYSPHLNLIETLWRKIKYEWLRPKDYLSAKELKDALFNIITKYDNEFSINISKNFFAID